MGPKFDFDVIIVDLSKMLGLSNNQHAVYLRVWLAQRTREF